MGINSLLQQDMQGAGLAGIDRLAGNAMFPQSQMDKTQYSVSSQMPTSAEVVNAGYEPRNNAYTGMPMQNFAAGGIASIPRFDGEDGSQVQAPENDFTFGNSDLNNLSYETLSDSNKIQSLNALKEADPQQYKIELMNALGSSLKDQYNANENYEPTWKQFSELKEVDPAQWNRNQLSWLGHQQGWQIGQNRSERNEAVMPVIQDQIEQSKKAGLSEDEINNILGSSSQSANIQNQNRIIRQQQAGGGAMGMTTQDYLTIAAILGSGAAAAYFAPAAGAGGAFTPAVGSGASFTIAPGAYTAAGTGGTALGADIFGGLAGTGGSFEGLTAAEQAAQLTGATGGMGPTYAQLGYAGAGAPSTTQAIAAADAASKAAAGGFSAKQAYAAKTAMDMLNSGAQTGGGGQPGPVQQVSAAPTIPTVNRFGVTGYEGQTPTSEVNFKPILVSKIKGAGGDYTFAEGGMAMGGISTLGSYSDGGRLLKGPGDGMSDNIPAKIGESQPARLADGEFVVPADVVSHLGNGSTDAGAKQLYAMMDKIRKARTGNKKQGKQIKPSKFLP